jgi:hypothetical protein
LGVHRGTCWDPMKAARPLDCGLARSPSRPRPRIASPSPGHGPSRRDKQQRTRD